MILESDSYSNSKTIIKLIELEECRGIFEIYMAENANEIELLKYFNNSLRVVRGRYTITYDDVINTLSLYNMSYFFSKKCAYKTVDKTLSLSLPYCCLEKRLVSMDVRFSVNNKPHKLYNDKVSEKCFILNTKLIFKDFEKHTLCSVPYMIYYCDTRYVR